MAYWLAFNLQSASYSDPVFAVRVVNFRLLLRNSYDAPTVCCSGPGKESIGKPNNWRKGKMKSDNQVYMEGLTRIEKEHHNWNGKKV